MLLRALISNFISLFHFEFEQWIISYFNFLQQSNPTMHCGTMDMGGCNGRPAQGGLDKFSDQTQLFLFIFFLRVTDHFSSVKLTSN